MDYTLNEQQKSMMQSISQNIKQFQLNPVPLHSSPQGQIFELTDAHNSQSRVLKVFYKRSSGSSYRHEKKIYENIKTSFVVRLEKCFEDKACSYFVLEHCQKGSLRYLLGRGEKIPIDTVRDIALQIAKGVHQLHKKSIVHHGIKPENILLTLEDRVKICDFGLAAKLEEGKSLKGCEGTLDYAPPEAIQLHDSKFDVWSLGCLIHELATGRLPFSFGTWKELTATLNEQYLSKLQYDPSLPLELSHLLRSMFAFERKDRLSIDQVIKHCFFTGEPLPAEQKGQKEEDRPLMAKKKSKGSLRSLEHRPARENLENLDLANRVPQRGKGPNYYKELMERKTKKQETIVEKGRPLSGQKIHPKAEESKQRTREGKAGFNLTTTLNSRKNSQEHRKLHPSPLNTKNLRIKPVLLNGVEISIDQTGITRRMAGKDDSKLFNVSPNGELVRLEVAGKEKHYTLENLPSKYHKEYEKCKGIVSEVQAYPSQPRVAYTDHGFLGMTLELTVMDNNTVSLSIPQERVRVDRLTSLELLSNKAGLREEVHCRLRGVYLKLAEMHELL